MALIGNAAMLLWYDIVPEQIGEHDEWHTREHFPERVAIPGFLRAQRWVAASASPRYFVTYEVSDVAILSSMPYAERLNHPTPWTQRMMPQFRGMVRGFCRIEHRVGIVLGAAALVVRYAPQPGREGALQQDLLQRIDALADQRSFASAFMLRADAQPEMTAEQRLRGRDATVDRVLIVTSYAHALLQHVRTTQLSPAALATLGAQPDSVAEIYDFACRADAALAA